MPPYASYRNVSRCLLKTGMHVWKRAYPCPFLISFLSAWGGLYFPDPFGLDGTRWLILANEMWVEVMYKTSRLKHLRIGVISHLLIWWWFKLKIWSSESLNRGSPHLPTWLHMNYFCSITEILELVFCRLLQLLTLININQYRGLLG